MSVAVQRDENARKNSFLGLQINLRQSLKG
jgi:hypothetical protein